MKYIKITAVFVTIFSLGSPVSAERAALSRRGAPTPPITLDLELDPIAFALSGSSLHAGLGRGRYRLDLGVFAATLPEAVHGNDGFDVSFHGFGVKLDRFWREARTGPFAGVDLGTVRVHVVDRDTRSSESGSRIQTGVRLGWRFSLPRDFYITPWVGVGYSFGARDRTIAERSFSESPLVVFPTVHLGRVFR